MELLYAFYLPQFIFSFCFNFLLFYHYFLSGLHRICFFFPRRPSQSLQSSSPFSFRSTPTLNGTMDRNLYFLLFYHYYFSVRSTSDLFVLSLTSFPVTAIIIVFWPRINSHAEHKRDCGARVLWSFITQASTVPRICLLAFPVHCS